MGNKKSFLLKFSFGCIVSYIMLSMSVLNCPPAMAAEAPANAVKAAKGYKRDKISLSRTKRSLTRHKSNMFLYTFF